jgi:hypothetical protein
MNRQPSLLLHPLFITSLLLLLANDHWWKYSYHNWLTGKLSDFTGVFVFAVCFIALLPVKRIVILIITAFLFTWWKSPLATPFIDWVNTSFHITVIRVVDYTDLLALFILPVAHYVQPVNPSIHFIWRLLKSLIGITTVFAMMATSMRYRYDHFYSVPTGHTYVGKQFKTRLTEQQFLHKLDSLHITFRRDSALYYPVVTENFYRKIPPAADSSVQWQPVKDTNLYFMKRENAYYIIPLLMLEKDTIRDVKFRVYELTKKKRGIMIESMIIPEKPSLEFWSNPRLRKMYYAIYRSLLIE